MTAGEDLVERLEAGNRGLQLSSDGRNRHSDAMRELLRSDNRSGLQIDAWALSAVRNIDPEPFAARSRVIATVVLVVLLLGSSTTFAARSNAVPGDDLYRVKRGAELVAVVVDGDIVATNRLEELELLTAERAGTERLLAARTDAEQAVAGTGDSSLAAELAELALPASWEPGRQGSSMLTIALPTERRSEFATVLPTGHVLSISSFGTGYDVMASGPWTVFDGRWDWEVRDRDSGRFYRLTIVNDELTVELPMAEDTVTVKLDASASDADGPATDASRSAFATTTPMDGEALDLRATDPISTLPTGPSESNPNRNGNGNRPDGGHRAEGGGSAADEFGEDQVGSDEVGEDEAGNDEVGDNRAGDGPDGDDEDEADDGPGGDRADDETPGPTAGRQSPTEDPNQPTTIPDLRPQPTPGSPNSPPSARSRKLNPVDRPGDDDGDDEDDMPGLLIQRDVDGLSGRDGAKYQDWSWTFDETESLSGRARLSMWVTAMGHDTSKRIAVAVELHHCDPACTRIGSGTVAGQEPGGFHEVLIDLGPVSVVAEQGSVFRLRVAVPADLSTADLWVGHGVGQLETVLTID